MFLASSNCIPLFYSATHFSKVYSHFIVSRDSSVDIATSYGLDGCAIAQAVSRWLPTAAARLRVWAEHVRFVVDKVTLGQVSPANHHSTNFSIIVITRGWHNTPIGGYSAEWTKLDFTPHYSN
jgi:hypothetical protein